MTLCYILPMMKELVKFMSLPTSKWPCIAYYDHGDEVKCVKLSLPPHPHQWIWCPDVWSSLTGQSWELMWWVRETVTNDRWVFLKRVQQLVIDWATSNDLSSWGLSKPMAYDGLSLIIARITLCISAWDSSRRSLQHG